MSKTAKTLDKLLFGTLFSGTILSEPFIYSDSQNYFSYMAPSLLISYGIGKIVYKTSNKLGERYKTPSSRL